MTCAPLELFRMILVAFFLIAAFFKLLVLHTNFIHALAVIIVFKAMDSSSSIRSIYGLYLGRSSYLFSVLHQQGREREINFDFPMVCGSCSFSWW